MELEDSGGADRMLLLMQLHFFCLSVLWLQGTAAQEVDTVRKAQLPALGVGFKVHHQGLMGVEWTQSIRTGGGIEKNRNVRAQRAQQGVAEYDTAVISSK